jgi:glycosyltransferase involved in cell wall biosynthesis
MLGKKRVLFFVPEFPVLSETFIERELSILERRGNIDLIVLAIKQSEGVISDNIIQKTFYKRLDVISITFGFLNLAVKPKKFLAGFNLVMKNKQRSAFSNLYLFLKAIGYSHVISTYKPQIILCHFLSEPSTLIMLAAIFLDVDFAISAHARDVFGKSKDQRNNAELVSEKALYSKFIVICNARAYAACLDLVPQELKSKVVLNYHGIDFERLGSSVGDSLRKPDDPYIFSIGRLVTKKGYEYLIDASKILNDSGIKHAIKIAGPGPLYDSLRGKIRSNGLEEVIQIMGNGNGIPNYVAMSELYVADIFVLPSIETEDGDAEGIPNTILEAGFFKKPIVSTNTGSIPEFVESDVNGVLVEQKNSQQLSNAIKRLIQDPKHAAELGESAYQKVMEKFDLSKNVVVLENLLLK